MCRSLTDLEDAELRSALHAFGQAARSLLQDALVGVYVTGSLVMGDYQPASSDIDFLAVTSSPLAQTDVPRIAALHLSLQRAHQQARRLEGAYAAAGRLSASGIAGLIVTVGSGKQAALSPSDYTADNMWALRHCAFAVDGPPPTSVMPPVAADDVRAALRDYLAELVARAQSAHGNPVDTLLNIARCLFGIERGRACTKAEAAEWLGGREPSLRDALSAAQSLRAGGMRDGDGDAVRRGLGGASAVARRILA